MFFDFLSNSRPVFAEEERDFAELCEELKSDSEFVGFMPSVILDLWPIYSLGCTHASRFTVSNNAQKIYVMPIAVSDCFIYPSLCEVVRDFYSAFDGEENKTKKKRGLLANLFAPKKEQEPEQPTDLLYGIKIEEIIPIVSPSLRTSHPLRLSRECECNVLYFRLALPNGTTSYLFAVCDTPENVWHKVIERYEIKTEMIIHSHKGFGHWFTSTPLYEHLKVTKKPHLLPRFYFRGRFISTDDSPSGSTEVELVEDDIRGGTSTIYRLPDKL